MTTRKLDAFNRAVKIFYLREYQRWTLVGIADHFGMETRNVARICLKARQTQSVITAARLFAEQREADRRIREAQTTDSSTN